VAIDPARYKLHNVDLSAVKRPDCVPLEEGQDFVFQHTETTYAVDDVTQKPEIRVWGISERGNSVCVRVREFEPYFYVKVKTEEEARGLANAINAYFDRFYQRKRGYVADGKYVRRYERVEGRSICGWHRNQPLEPMWKFYMAQPAHVAAARDSLEYANPAVVGHEIRTFEANVPYELRFMIDQRINGCEWIRLKGNSFARVPEQSCITTTQYELSTDAGAHIEPIPAMERGDVAPMRFLSYDIEVIRRKKGFPTAKEDPIIMIAVALYETGKGIVHKMVFATAPPGKGYGKIDDTSPIYLCRDEMEMLLAFREYVRIADPEALTGWNTSNFDMPYLADRADELGIYKTFMEFSRIRNKGAWIRQCTFQSKAHGAKKSNELLCEGRFEYDGLTFMLRGQMTKYRTYKLNYIS
jgi:DNA polymerase delta subunit 1